MNRRAVTKFLTDVNNIQALSDRPNEIDGLTSAELKQRFDKAGADIKNYLNTVLTEEIDGISGTIPSSQDFVLQTDSRLSDARKCNNTFSNWSTARNNLKILYGTSLPNTADNGTIFLMYD